MPAAPGLLSSMCTISLARRCLRVPWLNRIATTRSNKFRCRSWFRFACRRRTCRLKSILVLMQINQLANDRTQMLTMPTFAGYQQFNLGGAATGTPLPGQGASRPLIDGVVPASYPMYPGTRLSGDTGFDAWQLRQRLHPPVRSGLADVWPKNHQRRCRLGVIESSQFLI